MICKTFSFSRIEKTPAIIEKDINDFLKENTLKYVIQNESAVKGKVIITIFAEEKPGKIKAKVFKDQNYKSIDKNVNEFLENNSMKFVTQTFIGSNIYTIIFFSEKKEVDEQ